MEGESRLVQKGLIDEEFRAVDHAVQVEVILGAEKRGIRYVRWIEELNPRYLILDSFPVRRSTHPLPSNAKPKQFLSPTTVGASQFAD